MDPLTVFIASIVGSLVSDALRTTKRLSEFYPKSAEGSLEHYLGWVGMDGKNVRWWVERGEAVWIKAKYLRPIAGNIFDADKLGAVARAVKRRQGKDLIEFYASYGQIARITPAHVAESLAYREYDEGEPFTTGDREIDEYITARYRDETELDPEMDQRVAEAEAARAGDLGQWTASVRDGNHRVFGSVLGGEEKIAIRIYDNDVQGIREGVREEQEHGEPMSRRERELLRKMVTDTGLPHWLDEGTARSLGVFGALAVQRT